MKNPKKDSTPNHNKSKAKKKIGRPKLKLKLNEADVTELASIGCTNKTIASILECSENTLASTFRGACARGRANLKKSILKTQIDVAVKDRNTAMLVWLGKQHCDQKDSRQDVDHKIEIPFVIENFGKKESIPWKEKDEKVLELPQPED